MCSRKKYSNIFLTKWISPLDVFIILQNLNIIFAKKIMHVDLINNSSVIVWMHTPYTLKSLWTILKRVMQRFGWKWLTSNSSRGFKNGLFGFSTYFFSWIFYSYFVCFLVDPPHFEQEMKVSDRLPTVFVNRVTTVFVEYEETNTNHTTLVLL